MEVKNENPSSNPNPNSFMSAAPLPAITSIKLNGKNYYLRIFQTGKRMDRHLLEDKAEKDELWAPLWRQDDKQIMSLVLNSIEPNIKDMWTRLRHMYYGSVNLTWIYDTCKQYFQLEQGQLSLENYYTRVMSVCEGRNLYQPLTDDVNLMERQRNNIDVIRFLPGLKSEFEPLRAQILGGSQLATTPKVLSRLQRASIDTRKSESPDLAKEKSALMVENQSNRGCPGGRGYQTFYPSYS